MVNVLVLPDAYILSVTQVYPPSLWTTNFIPLVSHSSGQLWDGNSTLRRK